MEMRSVLQKATEASNRANKERRDSQEFLFNWRSGNSDIVVGWESCAAALEVGLPTLRVYISRGKGRATFDRTNPLTGERDVLTVIKRVHPKQKPRRGRPPKNTVDWERLGPEAPGSLSGTTLASPAKTVPKTRNRRTDDNRNPD